MDEIKTLLENVLSKTSDMKQAFIDLAPNSRMNMGIIGAMIIVGVLLALFGLKLVKLFTALCGFGIGAAIGAGVLQVMHPSQMTGTIILFGCAVVMAVLAFFLHKLGIFITVFIVSMAIAVTANMPHSLLIAGIYVVVSLILAILAVIFTEPLMIVVTAFAGGMSVGTAVVMLVDLPFAGAARLVIGVVVAIIGMIVQFMMQSRKLGKKEKKFSEKIKEQDSVESEVEKARMILDDFDDDTDEDDE